MGNVLRKLIRRSAATSRSSAAEGSSRPSHSLRPGPSQKYAFIGDDFHNIEQVTAALRGAGLETSNLIVGIDFTKSNEWTGKHSFNGQSLHAISDAFLNPYQQAIQIIGETLSPFDDDNLIPCFGFGDVSTRDQSVFAFYPSGKVCNGFEEVLSRYKEITPHVRLAGPTSFAPIIRVAIDIVEQSCGQYHVLLLIADGQVTRSVDAAIGKFSTQEQETIDAIVEASDYALSIVLVGVGDGPWDAMKQFDDSIPRRAFDNFQFVNFTSVVAKNLPKPEREAAFALAALMEIPSQYKATMELGILKFDPLSQGSFRPYYTIFQVYLIIMSVYGEGNCAPGQVRFGAGNLGWQGGAGEFVGTPHPNLPSRLCSASDAEAHDVGRTMGKGANGFVLPPPVGVARTGGSGLWGSFSGSSSADQSAPESVDNLGSGISESQACPVCLTRPKDMAFGCGHQTCRACAPSLQMCPLCRQPIITRLRLYT